MSNEIIKNIDELIKNIDEYPDINKMKYVCHLCVCDILDEDVKHKFGDSIICDSCWNKLKTMMDQEG